MRQLTVVAVLILTLCVSAAPAPAPRLRLAPPWTLWLSGRQGKCILHLASHGEYEYCFAVDGTYQSESLAYSHWKVSGSWKWDGARRILYLTEPEHEAHSNGMEAKHVVKKLWFHSAREAVILDYHNGLGEQVNVTIRPR